MKEGIERLQLVLAHRACGNDYKANYGRCSVDARRECPPQPLMRRKATELR